MRVVFYAAYVVMAVWLLLSSALRVVLLLGAGLPLDALPFVSGTIAAVALLLVLPRWLHGRVPRAARLHQDPGEADDQSPAPDPAPPRTDRASS